LHGKPAEFRADSVTKRRENDVSTAGHQEPVADNRREQGARGRLATQDSEPTFERKFTPRKPGGPRTVRQVAHDDDLESNAEAAPLRKPHPMESQVPVGLEDVADAATSVVYRPRNVHGTELARQIYRAMRTSAELVDSGRNGLPGFRVSARSTKHADASTEAGARGGVEFMISIDEVRNELLIDAKSKDADAVLKLLRVLDRPADPQTRAHLKSSTKYVCQIADQLPAEIDRIRAARGSTAIARRPVDGPPIWLADENQRRIPATKGDDDDKADDPKAQKSEDDTALGGALGNFKGEVNIQVIDDLNVMIIIGNEKDVEQIEKVIKQIEHLAEATAPQVHLVHLNNVDSESLAELLTSVYEKLTKFPGKATQPRESVAIIPVSKPNALLVIGPEADVESIRDLADELDTPVDPQTEFQVFRLKSAIASEVETLITEFYKERKALGAKVLVIADARSNAVIVRARSRDLDEIKELIHKMDRGGSDAVSQVRIFPLKNAVASELSAVINAAIQSVLSPPTSSSGGGGGQGAPTPGLSGGQVEEQFKSVKSTVLKFLSVDKGSSRQLKSGILSDIRITPESRANALIVTASDQSMELIAALIQTLDRPTSTVSEIKVFTLANADAELMVQQLNALFNSQSQGANQARQQLGVAFANADDASSSLVPLKFSVDTRTNSVIAVGSADALRVVEAIMLRLDESDLRARKNVVYRLKNSPATLIAQSVSQFFLQQRELAQADPNLISNVEQLEREIIVVPDTVSNSLLISSTPRYFPDIMAMIKKLDEMPKQVVIQAMIVEVQLNNSDEFGIELGLQSPVLFQRSLLQQPVVLTTTNTTGQLQTTSQKILSEEGTPGFNFNNAGLPLGNNVLSSVGTVGAQSLSNFSLGRTNSDLGFGGLVLSAGSDSVNMLLRALAANRRIQILSRPQIRALDNQLAEVFVGQTIPTVTSFQTNATTGVISPTLTQRETGIGMQVTPRINDDGQIVIQMYAYRSQLSREQVTVTTDSRGQAVGQRITDLSNVRTTVSVPSNNTVVIGGMISSRDESFTRKAPFLGDIPILGQLFRYDSRTAVRSELLIFLTPRILNGPQEEECLKEIEMGRLHFIESEVEEAHGPLRAIPAPDELFEEDPVPWIGPGGPPVLDGSRSSPTPLSPPPPPSPPPSPLPTPTQLPSPSSAIPPAPAPLVDPNLSQIKALRMRATEEDGPGVTTANLTTTSDERPRNTPPKKTSDRRK
jgi:general secretion pathway protein D